VQELLSQALKRDLVAYEEQILQVGARFSPNARGCFPNLQACVWAVL
jgi:hypothetical protein